MKAPELSSSRLLWFPASTGGPANLRNRRHEGGGWTAGHFAVLALGIAVSILSGCAGVSPEGVVPATRETASPPLAGRVHGGQQPVSGAAVRLYAAGTGGYGGASQSLLSSPGYVLTDSSGSFSLPVGSYACPSSATPVYFLSTGGNSGSGTANSAINMMAVAGLCGSLSSSTFVFIDEISTVAGAYALSGYMTSPTQLSTSGTTSSAVGLANAVASVANLASLSTGNASASTVGSNGSVPQSEIQTLGNILASCVNTGAPTSSPCGTLFGAATPPGGSVPTDTLQAALNIAKYPANNVITLFNLSNPTAPFQPSLNAAPNDWSIAVTYTGGGVSIPQAIAVDSGGNVWVASSNNALTELTAGTGSYAYGASGNTGFGLDAPSGIAVDTSGAIWIANCGDPCSSSGKASSITKITSAGSLASGAPYYEAGLSGAYGVAVDGSNNAWASNVYGNSVSKFSSAGAPVSGTSGFSVGSLTYPLHLAVDASGNVWTADSVSSSVSKLSGTGSAASGSPYSGGGLGFPEALAVDHSGQVWVASHDAGAVAELSNAGVILSGSTGYTGGGVSQPNAIAVDGNGYIWVANGVSGGGVTALNNSGVAQSSSIGYLASGLVFPNGIAVDLSGNVWVTGCGSYCTGTGSNPGSVTEYVGIATPVVTPLSVGIATNSLGSQP